MSILNASAGNSASQNSASSFYNNQSWSNSYTNGAGATASSNLQASAANAASNAAWQNAAQFNAEQASIQRAWQEYMANTVYQRSIKDMKAAGINPILAAGYGLGSASIGSGAAASMSAPEIFMGNSFADQQSASGSSGHGESESSGSSWSHSESGLATFLASMQGLVSGLLGKLNSSNTINIALNGLKEFTEQQTNSQSKDHKVSQKGYNQAKNGNGNPFAKGTTAYEMYELQKATNSFTKTYTK